MCIVTLRTIVSTTLEIRALLSIKLNLYFEADIPMPVSVLFDTRFGISCTKLTKRHGIAEKIRSAYLRIGISMNSNRRIFNFNEILKI